MLAALPTEVVALRSLVKTIAVVPLPVSPFDGHWAFNPSIHYDRAADLWRCSLRHATYHHHSGGGTSQPSGRADRSKVTIAVLDPATWTPCAHVESAECDGQPRTGKNLSTGFEDLRLFTCADGKGLRAVAAAMMLRPLDGGQIRNDQVLLGFDDDHDIVSARPIRGAWSSVAQKNWSPFEGDTYPRFLYSIDRGVVIGVGDDGIRLEHGALGKTTSAASRVRTIKSTTDTRTVTTTMAKAARLRAARGIKGQAEVTQGVRDSTRGSDELRGGSQLIRIDDAGAAAPRERQSWLGIGHDMMFGHHVKVYWHTLYLVDGNGRVLMRSAPFKLAPESIEFCAGMALGPDGDTLVVSFGVDDYEARLAILRLPEMIALLRPVQPALEIAGEAKL